MKMVEEKEVYRKRGHFYSLLDEYQRCKNGIKYTKKMIKKFLTSQNLLILILTGRSSFEGKKSKDGECKVRDTRNTSGVDNCSLGYRNYLLKVIAATNQGQSDDVCSYFFVKEAYDDVDKKYYVVDCFIIVFSVLKWKKI